MDTEMSTLLRWLGVNGTPASVKDAVMRKGAKKLGVSEEDIYKADDPVMKKAVRNACLKFHPDKPTGSDHDFTMLQVLIEHIKNPSSLDQYDEPAQPKRPSPSTQNNNFRKKYKTNEDMEDFFRRFFGSNSVYANEIFMRTAASETHLRNAKTRIDRGKDQYAGMVASVELPLTLSEIARGCTKEIDYQILTLEVDANGRIPLSKRISIFVPCSFKGDVIRVDGCGHLVENGPPGDLNVVVKVIPSPHYTWDRKSNDVVITLDIPIRKSLEGIDMTVPDVVTGEPIRITQRNIQDIVNNGKAQYIVSGCGMYCGNSTRNKRGNMIININIIETLKDDEQTRMFKSIFAGYKINK